MSELISGKEALIALANGKDVEWRSPEWSGDNWHSVLTSQHTCIGAVEILNETYHREDTGSDQPVVFRLKPRTITLKGIEVPAPFEPKHNQKYFYPYTENMSGYADDHYEENIITRMRTQFGAWRTEDEIKQVVAALRNVFKGE